ncbi:hypothetical protein BD410DRAFT_582463 [Rickenella mellea]|uniref:Uncharacterized protein n=1 Tax=Rickenella mellea TaxID=50990 RepID=A0A4Y7PRD5_9AGAM|nr:hypothetical protein BD410DRAFT_582463 [Rickenella mellea]
MNFKCPIRRARPVYALPCCAHISYAFVLWYYYVTRPSEFNKKTSLCLVIFSITSFLSYDAWSVHLWSTALTFGSRPECNHSTKYVLFWITVRLGCENGGLL